MTDDDDKGGVMIDAHICPGCKGFSPEMGYCPGCDEQRCPGCNCYFPDGYCPECEDMCCRFCRRFCGESLCDDCRDEIPAEEEDGPVLGECCNCGETTMLDGVICSDCFRERMNKDD